MKPARGSCSLLRRVSLLSIVAIAKSQILPCPTGVTNQTISNTAEADDLAEALLCSGGQFEATWVGEVPISRTFSVLDGTSLKVSGSPSGGSVVDGGGLHQLFNVSGGSVLELQGLSLAHGTSSSGAGGAVLLSGLSSMKSVDCSFEGNNATTDSGDGWGGAICSIDGSGSTVIIQGETTFAGNSAGGGGGAIALWDSTLTIEGETAFVNSTTLGYGGAISLYGSTVGIEGETTFVDNFSFRSGAFYVGFGSTVTVEGEATFANNDGGAISVTFSSTLAIGGQTTFVRNAGGNGGAIEVRTSALNIQGETTLRENTASGGGGAIAISDSSSATFEGEIFFTSNGAYAAGGAVEVSDESTVLFEGEATFAGNSARFAGGGAIGVSDSSIVTLGGETTLTGNTAGLNGGAIGVEDSIVAIEGEASFTFNRAELHGGAIGLTSSTVTTEGSTIYLNNSAAVHGGAIYEAEASTVTIGGETTCAENRAGSDGGAIHARETSTLTLGGEGTFTRNLANSHGGAIYVLENSTVTIGGGVNFEENEAFLDGGAIYGELSNVSMHGNTAWTGNRAGSDGGALYVVESTCVIDSMNASFTTNTAGGNGGAISAFSTAITVEGSTFRKNTAKNGAGGGVHCSDSFSAFNGSVFTSNEAVWGGGLGMFSSGSVWSETEPDTSGPANATNCVFERNTATDGGGVYSAFGYDFIQDCQFQDNFAAGSGGGYLHSGVAVALHRCTFLGNRAGDEGLAVLSLGIAENISDVVFDSNTFFCSSGTYGYEMDVSEAEVPGTCRFDLVCSRCASSCEQTPLTVQVMGNTSIPTCQPMMAGAAGTAGATLQTLELERGYYRTSATSDDILECHRQEACVGGNNATQYCAQGYRDSYCAVCDEDYGSGYQFSCSSCVDQDTRSAVAVAAILVLALLVVAVTIADLVSVVDEQGNTRSSWKNRVHSCRNRIVEAVPLTAIKIVLVAWQILTQFTTVVDVVYPDVYEKFLSVINMVNFDLGLLPSVSCMVNINFYGRLLFATIAPLAVLGALGLTHTAARSKNRHSPASLQAVRGKHVSVALFVMFIVYSSVSFTVFQTFVCETLDNGVTYLRADYSLTCTTSAHTAWKAYAGLMIIVYPVGIPALFAWWLIANRRELMRVGSGDSSGLDSLQPMRDLWEPYKPRRYYYEVVECFRRIVLTGLGVFLFPGSAAQVALEVVFAAGFMVISEMISPFVDPMDAWLYRSGMWVVFFSMYLALLLKVDASDEDSQSQQVFAKLLIVANAGLILAVVVQVVVSVRKGLGVSARDLPVANKSSRRLSFAQECGEESNGDDKHEAMTAKDEASTTADLPGCGTRPIA